MTPETRVTAANFIKGFEGCRLNSYQDQGGVWTIGYGSTGKDIGPGLIWTLEECEYRMQGDLLFIGAFIETLVKVPLTVNQEAALMSFTYNLGVGALKRSTLLLKLNDSDYAGAATEFPRWVKVNGVPSDYLVARRAKEQALFLT